MRKANIETKIEPPKIIPSLAEGFNSIASHIYIIVFPIIFDLLLWFGPLVRIKDLLLPAILNATDASINSYAEENQILIQNTREMWTLILEQFNILFSLRTFPIGIPSLLAGKGISQNQGVLQNPLGNLSIIEVQTLDSVWWIVLGLFVIGVILGSLYYSLIAGVAGEPGASLKN